MKMRGKFLLGGVRVRLAVPALGMLALAGLAAGSTPAEAFIIEGRDVRADDPISTFAVQVVRQGLPYGTSDRPESRGGSCSGSLIAPDLVLTAAHCLGQRMEVRFLDRRPRRGFFSRFRGSVAIRVIGQIAHPDYDAERVARQDPLRAHEPLDHDLALLRLERPAPSAWYVPVRLATEPQFEALEIGAVVTAAGYGTNRAVYGSSRGVGRLRRVDVSYAQTLPSREDVVASPRGAGICSGDSGGPLIVRDGEGMPLLWGVAARVSEGCEGFGLTVRVVHHLAWIAGAARELRETARR